MEKPNGKVVRSHRLGDLILGYGPRGDAPLYLFAAHEDLTEWCAHFEAQNLPYALVAFEGCRMKELWIRYRYETKHAVKQPDPPACLTVVQAIGEKEVAA